MDVGGATTDVYSVAKGLPTKEGVSTAGLPEPYAKRTVEGDLGLFHNLDTLSCIAEQAAGLYDEKKSAFEEKVEKLRGVLSIPEGTDQTECQLMLSQLAVKTAVDRHVGTVELIVTHNGEFWMQRGKDLTQVKTVIGAGGPVAFSSNSLPCSKRHCVQRVRRRISSNRGSRSSIWTAVISFLPSAFWPSLIPPKHSGLSKNILRFGKGHKPVMFC